MSPTYIDQQFFVLVYLYQKFIRAIYDILDLVDLSIPKNCSNVADALGVLLFFVVDIGLYIGRKTVLL